MARAEGRALTEGRKAFLISLAIVALFVSAPAPVAAEDDTPHQFDCGADAAPSGPYLHAESMRIFEYECTTGLLIPGAEASSTSLCIRGTGEGSESQPLVGACALVDATSDSVYAATFFVALMGSYDHGQGYAHEQGRSEDLLECPDAASACRPLTAGIPGAAWMGLGVTYLHVVMEDELPCDEGATQVESHLVIWGPSGSVDTGHQSTGTLCV